MEEEADFEVDVDAGTVAEEAFEGSPRRLRICSSNEIVEAVTADMRSLVASSGAVLPLMELPMFSFSGIARRTGGISVDNSIFAGLTMMDGCRGCFVCGCGFFTAEKTLTDSGRWETLEAGLLSSLIGRRPPFRIFDDDDDTIETAEDRLLRMLEMLGSAMECTDDTLVLTEDEP